MAVRKAVLWICRACAIFSGCDSHSGVEPWISVNRKVTVPVGRVLPVGKVLLVGGKLSIIMLDRTEIEKYNSIKMNYIVIR
jgi:hypothetical protein